MTQSGHRSATNLGHFLGVTALIIPVGIVCTELFDGEIDKHADLVRQGKPTWPQPRWSRWKFRGSIRMGGPPPRGGGAAQLGKKGSGRSTSFWG